MQKAADPLRSTSTAPGCGLYHGILQQGSLQCRGSEQARLLVGSMDGSMSIVDAEDGTVLGATKAHSKYCVQATWNSSGTGFVTASWDQSLCIYEWPAGQCL